MHSRVRFLKGRSFFLRSHDFIQLYSKTISDKVSRKSTSTTKGYPSKYFKEGNEFAFGCSMEYCQVPKCQVETF